MPYRTGTALDTSGMLDQLNDFLTTRNEYQNIIVTGTGDGVLSANTAADAAPTEDWVLTCTAIGPSATFTVVGSISGAQANATSAVPYDNTIVAFTITDGAVAWAVNDTITFDLQSNMGTTTPYEISMQKRTTRSIVQSNNGVQYNPRCFQNHTLVEGKFPEEKGLKLASSVMQSNDPNISGYDIVEPTWDSGLDTYSVSLWVRTATSTNGYINSNDFYDTDKESILYLGAKFSNEKNGLALQVSENRIESAVAIITGGTSRSQIGAQTPDSKRMRSPEWQLLTTVVTPTDYSFYVNDTLINTSVGYPNTTRPYFSRLFGQVDGSYRGTTYAFGSVDYFETSRSYLEAAGFNYKVIGFEGVVADFCVWNKALSGPEVTALYGSSAAVSAANPDIEWKLQYNNEILQQTIYTNTSTRGFNTIVDIGYDETGDLTRSNPEPSVYIASAPIDTSMTVDPYTTGIDLSRRGNEWSDEYISRDKAQAFCAARAPLETIEKFWFVANEDRVIVAFKIHDTGATVQKDPVYQMMHAGLLKQSGHNSKNLLVFGSSLIPADWQSTAVGFTNGAQDGAVGFAFGGAKVWHHYTADTGGANEASVRSIGGAHYVWPINIYAPRANNVATDESGFAGLANDMFTHMVYGVIDGIAKVSPLNVIAEDIITVDGDDYVVMSNVWSTAEGDWFALKLA